MSIWKKVNCEFDNYEISNYCQVKNITTGNDNINSIGIYGIFIGTYSKFYKNFIQNFEIN
jgi:hypothetical protein